MEHIKIFTTTIESVLCVYKDFFLNDFHSKTSKIAMISYILEDISNSPPYKFLNSSPVDVSVANNKQKVCTRAWNTAIFHMDSVKDSKIPVLSHFLKPKIFIHSTSRASRKFSIGRMTMLWVCKSIFR